MLTSRHALLGIAVLFVALALCGCNSQGRTDGSGNVCGYLPTDLPSDPEACTQYCKVWVPPVTRKMPRLVEKTPGCTKYVPECVLEARYTEVCDRERCNYDVETPGLRCEQAVVQVKPGGYKWKKCGDCWKYCYEEPCYQWCEKTVEEEGIRYCMERPPEYHVEVTHVPSQRCRTVYQPAEYCVEYVEEVYRPGHYEWQPTKQCTSCDCPAPCPTIPVQRSKCEFVGVGVPRVN